jgi:hypothetical protein
MVLAARRPHSSSTSTADMDKGCPSRGRRAAFTKFCDRPVQRVCDVIEVERLPCEEGFVELTRDGWSIVVTHHPTSIHVIADRDHTE